SVIVLRQWHSRYLHGGLSALVPTEWAELPEEVWSLIDQRYLALGGLAEAETITPEDIHQLAERQGWTVRQAQRWLLRYRVGGMFGLAPARRGARSRSLPYLGALGEEQRNELFRRRTLLGDLAELEHVSNPLLTQRAKEVGLSLRTLRDYHTR